MRLYVIGNGFDIYHGLDTSYPSFGLYLKREYRNTYDLLIDYLGFNDLDSESPESMSNPLWSDFETNLSLLDTDNILEANMDAMPNYASDSFRDRDRYTLQIEMERILDFLTTDLYKAFKEFILSVKISERNQRRAINLDKDAIYLTFNYTDTLTQYYGIPDENILFIHKKADPDVDELILGHGIDPDNFNEEPVKPPKGLSDEDLERWYEYQSDQYDYSYERGKDAINQYFSATFKGTETIIKANENFFAQLNEIDEVYILGHSLAEVDLPYFQKLTQSVKPNAKWVATFYDPADEERHRNKVKELGIKEVSVIRMEQL